MAWPLLSRGRGPGGGGGGPGLAKEEGGWARGERGCNRVNFPKPSSYQQTRQVSLRLQAYRKCISIINSPGHSYPF